MRKVAIIPCAGDSRGWANYLGVEKHLAPLINGEETILERIVLLLRAYGIHEIFILTHKPTIHACISDAKVIVPDRRAYLSDTILSSESVWGDRNVILLGDVYFSTPAMRQVLLNPDRIRFFGYLNEGFQVKLRGYRPELFALTFDSSECESMRRCLNLNSMLARIRDTGSQQWLWDPRRLKYLFSEGKVNLESRQSWRELLEYIIRFICIPDPPIRLGALNLPSSRYWRIPRLIRSNVGGVSGWAGKLWGLLTLISGAEVRLDVQARRSAIPDSFFEEITGFAQDCDVPQDYDRLLQYLSQDHVD